MPKRIDIDEDFILSLQSRLRQINDEVPGAQLGNDPSNSGAGPSGGAIKDLTVQTGPTTFPIGNTFSNFIKTNVGAIDTRLVNHHTMLTEFVADITDMLDNTDHIESLNSISIADIQPYFSDGAPGSGSNR
jgi:hypothetical protein